MRLLRLPILQRLVAILLMAGGSLACVPVADAAAAARSSEDDLRAAFGDDQAVEAALEAARGAATPEAAIDAFVRAYLAASEDPNAVREVSRLLLDHTRQFGAPALPHDAAVWLAANAAAPALDRALGAAVQISASSSTLAASHRRAGEPAAAVWPFALRSPQQARAP